jgi:hypothetical protein
VSDYTHDDAMRDKATMQNATVGITRDASDRLAAYIEQVEKERDDYFAALAAIVWKQGGKVVLADADLMGAPRTLESFDHLDGKRVIRTAATLGDTQKG